MQKHLKNILIFILCLPVCSKNYGQALFSSLDVPLYTKATALGGIVVAHPDGNVNLFTLNPALLNGTEKNISFEHTFYLADISGDQLSYAHDFNKIGLVGFSLQYISYGTLTGYDEYGEETGDFSAHDFIFTSGYSHSQGNFSVGANVKFGASDFVDNFASAILIDIGGIFRHPTQDLVIGLNIKNAGFIISDYTGSATSELPFDVQVGAAFKPSHMPLRFNINLYKLTDFDIPYGKDDAINDAKTGPFDKIFSHVSLGTEILVNKNFHLLAGYNHLKREELRLENKSAWAGISYGLEITVKNFELAYSRAHFVAGKAINQLGLSLDLKAFNKIEL